MPLRRVTIRRCVNSRYLYLYLCHLNDVDGAGGGGGGDDDDVELVSECYLLVPV